MGEKKGWWNGGNLKQDCEEIDGKSRGFTMVVSFSMTLIDGILQSDGEVLSPHA